MNELEARVGGLERENRILARKLHRSHRNRVLSEDAKDMSDALYRRVITDLDEKNRELARLSRELEQAYEIIKAQKERMEGELNVAREIQMSMLPSALPACPDRIAFDVHGTVIPAREVGGDFYDFFLIDEDCLCFCIGDVADKGVPAALFMAITKALIRSKASELRSTAGILAHVNNELSRDNSSCMFVTVFAGILNVRTGTLVYTNAGHNPPYLQRRRGPLERLDRVHGLMLGAMRGVAYQEDTTVLSGDEMLLLYTDGVTETRNADRAFYSEERLAALLSTHSCASTAEDAVQTIVSHIEGFRGEADQTDDVTLLAIRYAGQQEQANQWDSDQTVQGGEGRW